MAVVKQFDVITGSIANLSFYTRKGSDKVYVRTKGGASKAKIKRNPEFANVRRNNKEFGGCSKMSKQIRSSFNYLAHVADYNLAPALCSIAKLIQKNDIVSEWGERRIELSKYRTMIQGFEFNRIHRFGSMLRIPLQWEIKRDSVEATVLIPEFGCNYGLYLPANYSLFRISASLGVVTDMQLSDNKHNYEPTHGENAQYFSQKETTWYSTKATVPEQKLTLALTSNVLDIQEDDTLVLTVVLEFGSLNALGNPEALKHAGAGMILGVR